ATHVTGVEHARTPSRIAEANANTVNQALGRDVVTINHMPVQRFLQLTDPTSWDLVIADPPYDIDEDELLSMIVQSFHVLMYYGLFAVKSPQKAAEPVWPEDTYVVDARRYGEARVYFVRRTGYCVFCL